MNLVERQLTELGNVFEEQFTEIGGRLTENALDLHKKENKYR